MVDMLADLASIRAPLFVPANRPERFAKAAASGADAVILDLEDAVAHDAKDGARAALATDFNGLPVIVRINAAGTAWHAADVEAVRQLSVTAVMVPKAEDPSMLASVASALGGHIPLIALVESVHGLAQVQAIAATPGVMRLAFGSVDFCADLGCAHLRDILLPVRVQLALAARLAGIAAPIDGVTMQLDDAALAHDDAVHARALGFSGKLCIHLKQVAEVKRAFAPTEAEIIWARRVLAAGEGAVALDGTMVDEPVRICARAILAGAC